MENRSIQIKIQRMVSLNDVESLIKQLEVMYRNVPKFELGKRSDLATEVANLVDYTNSTGDWFKTFSRFVLQISPFLKEKVETGQTRGDSSVQNLIERAAN